MVVVALVMTSFALVQFGCGKKSPQDIIAGSLAKTEEFASTHSSMKFSMTMNVQLQYPQLQLEHNTRIQGENAFPDKQRYEERRTSRAYPSGKESNFSFDYITLDGGTTAYVKGTPLESIGEKGWVHYTPPAGQSHYFDFLELLQSQSADIQEARILQDEEMEGRSCWHISMEVDPQRLIQAILGENPELEEQLRNERLEENVEELRTDIWIEKESQLPMQISNFVSLVDRQAGGKITLRVITNLFYYKDAGEVSIESPAVYKEAR